MKKEQTDSRATSLHNKISTKNLARIKLHFKTEKTSHSAKKNPHRTSEHRNALERLSPISHSKKGLFSSASIKQDKTLKWRLGKTQDAVTSPQLPQINDARAASGWVSRNSLKKPMIGNSLKIPFKELIAAKQISREDRLQNLRRIREEFKEVVNASNFISVRNKESFFRAYVEKGNNGVLVKELLKKRWWWHLQEQATKANLMWTQWFNKAFISQMLEEQSRGSDSTSYISSTTTEQAKFYSIRKILDQSTFTKIKGRISLKQEHYLRAKKRMHLLQEGELKQVQTPNTNYIHNHVDGCLQLHSKKLLFKNLYEFLQKKDMDPFAFIPVTYYVDSDCCQSLNKLYDHCNSLVNEPNSLNLWIVKPGQNSNRGYGISVHAGMQSLKAQIERRAKDGKCSLVVQKYIQDCFLVEGRKFDIRCYILLTTVNGILKGYWYADGYIRTSSEEYNPKDVQNRIIHLTNDAVQKNNDSYGKFQDYNKMSFTSFRKYIFKKGFPTNAFDKAYQQMKNIAFYLIASACHKIRRRQYSFELFGLDYMLDGELNPFLIEANSNPCLQTSGVILGKLIPELVDNVLMTAVDPLFPPPDKGRAKDYLSKDYFRSNKFQLIFSESNAV